MKIETKIVSVFILVLLAPLASYGQQSTGIVELDIKSMAGENTDYHGMALKIYQDNKQFPFKTIESLSGNPYQISLPLGHQYKIELYVNSMFANVGYVNLQNYNEDLKLTLSNPGSIRFTAVYDDGNTPINNATVTVKSKDGTYEYWTASTTDDVGNTIRFWLQPTILDDDYYIATVSIGNNLSYSYYPINILAGISRDIKITTPWPDVNPPIVVSIYKSTFQKVSKSDGNFLVQLYDNKKDKIAESKVNVMGDAYFSNLKVGGYIFHAVDLNNSNNGEWGVINTILDGKQTSVQIFKNQTNNKNEAIQTIPTTNNTQNMIETEKINNVDINKPSFFSDQKIMKYSETRILSSQGIPGWIKNIAGWWAEGQISDSDFASAIQFLVEKDIIKAQN